MNWKLLATVFGTVFIAELGDKTQVSTMLYAAGAENPKLTVFLGSALALVLSSALGVFAGSLIGARLNPKTLAWAAGIGFILVGVWTIWRAGR